MFDISGKTALITGAGQGVGRGIAIALNNAKAKVLINDLYPDRAEAVAKEIKNAEPVAFDVADYDAVESALASLDIDILVNNAGIPETMAMLQFKDSTPDDWRPYIDVNLYGVLNCTRAIINQMCEKNWGRVITISSGAGSTGMRNGVSTYAAGKGGALSFMRHLAWENARQGITANTISLGLMDKIGDVAGEESEFSDAIAKLAKGIPVGRLGTPEDVGAMCVYLASPEASWITGQNIHLNGGSLTP